MNWKDHAARLNLYDRCGAAYEGMVRCKRELTNRQRLMLYLYGDFNENKIFTAEHVVLFFLFLHKIRKSEKQK